VVGALSVLRSIEDQGVATRHRGTSHLRFPFDRILGRSSVELRPNLEHREHGRDSGACIVTEPSSGLEELENRMQRRGRTDRSLRKPRSEASAESGTSPEDGNQETADDTPSPSPDATTSEAQPESQAAGARETSTLQAERSGDEGHSNQELQKQIADAIAPLIGDLQKQIADTVRQQMQEVSDINQQHAQPRPADVSEGAEAHQVDAQEESTPQGRKQQRSPLQAVIQKALAGIRSVFRWFLKALRRVWQAVINALRALVVKVILGVAKAVLRALILGLMHRLEEKPEPKRADSEQPTPSP
jgi:hypothetical protein